MDIVDEINSGSFTTSFKLSKDATAGDDDLTSQMYAMVTEMDRSIIKGN